MFSILQFEKGCLFMPFLRKHSKFLRRFISVAIIFAFLGTTILPSYAQAVFTLPTPGTMVNPSPSFVPVLLRGMVIHPENPLHFDFIVDSGNTQFTAEQIKEESTRLVKYFLAAMTVPRSDLWVNLSPYEEDRMIPDALGKTELGRDMLAQDYILKQLTASLIHPESDLGKAFWKRVYAKAYEQFGTTKIPADTFNKVWIVPEEATVFEHGQAVYITKSKLKVLMEEDYIALAESEAMLRDSSRSVALQAKQRVDSREHIVSSEKPLLNTNDQILTTKNTPTSTLSSQIVREIVLPEIEHEVNYGKNFAPIRQIYQSLILSQWYKETIKQSLLSQVYVDQKKIKGVDLSDPNIKDQIYARYVESFKKGVFDLIRTEHDQAAQKFVPRKYFSGGLDEFGKIPIKKDDTIDPVNSQPQGDFSKLSVKIEPEEKDQGSAGSPLFLRHKMRRMIESKINNAIKASNFAWVDDSKVKIKREDVNEAIALYRISGDFAVELFTREESQWNEFDYGPEPSRYMTYVEGFRLVPHPGQNEAEPGSPLAVQQQERLLEAQKLYSLSNVDTEYLAQLWMQLLSGSGANQKPLRLALNREDLSRQDREDLDHRLIVILASLLTAEERQKWLGSYSYQEIQADPKNAEAARQAAITANSMDGGIGEALSRIKFLKTMAKEHGLSQDEIDSLKMAAKGTDLGYTINIQGEKVFISIAEAKILQLIKIAEKKQFAGMKFQPLVNWQSKGSYFKLLDETVYLFDRLTQVKPGLTYRQALESKDVQVLDMLEQADLPWVEKESQDIVLIPDSPGARYRQPGGHGQWGFLFLWNVVNGLVPADGNTHIRVFYNGDNINSHVDGSVAGWMVRNKIPIAKLTTNAMPIDKKGGKDGVKIVMVDGKPVYVPVQIEKGDAVSAGQEQEFYSFGQKGGFGEEGEQPFNTNIFYINETVLSDVFNALRQIDGFKEIQEIFKIIAPLLIEKPYEKKMTKNNDDHSYRALDGAIGTAMHRLNEFFLTTANPEARKVLADLGLDRILFFVDVPRTKFFTPVKDAFDMYLQSYSDYYSLDLNNMMLKDVQEDLVPPEAVLNGPQNHWKEYQNLVDAFGVMKVQKLESLSIDGLVKLRDARLIGKVRILNLSDAQIDLNEAKELAKLKDGDGKLVLNNVAITIGEDQKITFKESQDVAGRSGSPLIVKWHLYRLKSRNLERRLKAIEALRKYDDPRAREVVEIFDTLISRVSGMDKFKAADLFAKFRFQDQEHLFELIREQSVDYQVIQAFVENKKLIEPFFNDNIAVEHVLWTGESVFDYMPFQDSYSYQDKYINIGDQSLEEAGLKPHRIDLGYGALGGIGEYEDVSYTLSKVFNREKFRKFILNLTKENVHLVINILRVHQLTRFTQDDFDIVNLLIRRVPGSTGKESSYNRENKIVEFFPKARELKEEGFDFEVQHIKEEGRIVRHEEYDTGLKEPDIPNFDPNYGPNSWTGNPIIIPAYDELVVDALEKIEIVQGEKISGASPVGGIDMNEISVDRQGSSSIDIQFDPMVIEQILQNGVDGFRPVIIDLVPIHSIFPLLGIKEKEEGKGTELSLLKK